MSPASIVLERILCPTDFSELSAEALLHARKFAECYEAELHILHVVDEAYQHWMAIGPEGMPVGPSALITVTSVEKSPASTVSTTATWPTVPPP